MTTAPFAPRAAAILLAAAVVAGCSGNDGPTVEEKLAASARAAEAGDTSYTLPPLSRPPEFGARPEVDSDGTLDGDAETTVFRQPDGQGQDIPPRIAQMPGLSDGTRAFLARAVPAEADAEASAGGPSPELIERMATGGDVADGGSEATGGRQVRIERDTGWFD